MINVSFDMETADPDDVFTLCLLSHHPRVNLVSVTVTPGEPYQIGLVKFILNKLQKDIPVGSRNPNHPKQCVSAFHYKWLGQISSAKPDDIGANVLEQSIKQYPDLVIVCGASLGNIGALLEKDILLSRIVVQGGFAGDNIVPPQFVLDKFRGKITCPTFNLNGDIPSALKVVSTDKISQKHFVSKNVCHGVIYDQDMHQFMKPFKDQNLGLQMMFDGMSKYLSKTPSGKAFHDPLAACVAIESNICLFEQVELYRHKNEWGSKLSSDSNTMISIAVDMDKFRATLIG